MCDPGNCSNFGESEKAENTSDNKVSLPDSEALNPCSSKKRKLNDDQMPLLEEGSVEMIELDDTHEFKQELFDGEMEEIENNAGLNSTGIKQENSIAFMEHPNENILPMTPEAKQGLIDLSLSLHKRKCSQKMIQLHLYLFFGRSEL